MSLHIAPATVKAASRYVRDNHRHHPAPQGGLFAACVVDESGVIRGVAIAGRPLGRGNRRRTPDHVAPLNSIDAVEITRVATDGARNACSILYGAMRAAAKALGYRRVFTYTLASEPGTSLRAAGFVRSGTVDGRSWTTPSRPRTDKHPTVDKVRWEVVFAVDPLD